MSARVYLLAVLYELGLPVRTAVVGSSQMIAPVVVFLVGVVVACALAMAAVDLLS